MSETKSTNSANKEISMNAAQLKTFLTDAPLTYKSKLQPQAEKYILTQCYRSLWSDDSRWLQAYFFPEGDSDNLPLLLEKYNLIGSKKQDLSDNKSEGDQSLDDTDEEEYWENQRGKQCGRLFKRGESVYHCRNCGFDDTCVMCSKCFHSTDHEGHDVKIWIGRGAGCCDCGDPEAWKVPLHCKIHSLDPSSTQIPSKPTQLKPLSSVPSSVLNSIQETINVVMDYILETFAASPEDVMSIGNVDSIKKDCADSHQALGLPVDFRNQMYACVLWNDEKHSFDSVISVLQTALDCTDEQAELAAQSVHTYGRHVVKESVDIQSLISAASIIHSIGLAVTICSAHKVVREEIAGLLLNWLNELVSGRYKFFSSVEGGNCIIRDIICDVLSADWALLPELARLSTRYRRAKMLVDVDDAFDFGDEGGVLDDEDDILMFDDADGDMQTGGMFFDEVMVTDEEYEEDDDDDENISLTSETQRALVSIVEIQRNNVQAQIDPHTYLSQSADTSDSHEEHDTTTLKRRRSSTSSQPKPSKTNKQRDILDMDWSLDAWLDYTDKLELAERQIAKDLGVPVSNPEATVASAEINNSMKKEFKRKLRLDYLLQFDLRLWKTARMDIKDLLISTFISNFQYRPVLGTRFARNYPELVDAFFFKDREPENSVSTLSVQLLTVPTVASILVKEYKFFGMVCSILANFFLTDNIHMILPEDYSQAQVDSSFRAIGRHRYAYTIYDLRYVMNAEQVKLEISKSPLYLRHFIDMMYQFQAMDPLKRQTDEHVAYESQTWVNAFNVTLQIAKLCRQYAACYDALQSETTLLNASHDLCRTIYRVLKAICDWNPHLSPGAHPSLNEQGTRIIIKGISQQTFHHVHTPHAGTFDIVKYDVTTEPVSFHHPFHWLLSELFENVSLLQEGILEENGWMNGFKQMVNDAFENNRSSTFLTVLEYPIRTLVILSQINCGVWVRNGYGIRNQSHTYKDINVRENTLDRDIYLLQVGFVVCDSNQLLLTLIDRFQLQEWFQGNPDKTHEVYDESQKTFMVEELLNLLIISATEHGYASGTTIDQRIRRAIIQYLGLARLSYSELLKLIPESLSEHGSFESELNKVANFRAPDGLSDKGMYEIKSECLDEIDPYFWHYTRNKREEAHSVLKQHWNQLNPESKLNDEEEFLVQPRVCPIETGPFKHLGNFLHATVFTQILTYALWNSMTSKRSKSEVILDEALYLGMLAVTDTNNGLKKMESSSRYFMDASDICGNFYENASTDEYSIQVSEDETIHANLLDILLRCLNNNELSHAHKRLHFIVNKIEEFGLEEAKLTISTWKETRKKLSCPKDQANPSNNGLSEYEQKKAAAKARQAAIMSQFAVAQSKFLEHHADLYKNEDDGDIKDAIEETKEDPIPSGNDFEIVRKCHFPSDNCIVCQESFDGTKLYGMLGLVQCSNIHRLSPVTKDVWADILEAGNRLNNPWISADEENSEKGTSFSGFPTAAHLHGVDISSCGHLIHAECFGTYQHSVENQNQGSMRYIDNSTKGRFLCPFCKALGNVLVPIVWKGKREAYPGVMAPTTPYEELYKTLQQVSSDVRQKLDSGVDSSLKIDQDPNLTAFDEESLTHLYKNLTKAIDRALHYYSDASVTDMKDSLLLFYDMYAYTIGNFEIAQRGAENTQARDLTVEHTGTFIDSIPRTSQTLLKILAMTNMLVPKLMNSPWQTDERQLKENILHQQLSQLIPDGSCSKKPLLMDDPFKVLVHFGFSTADYPTIEAHHIMRALYIAELAKNVIGIAQSIQNEEKVFKDNRLNNLLNNLCNKVQYVKGEDGVQRFVDHVLRLIHFPDRHAVYEKLNTRGFTALLHLFTLPYLRKSLLLMVAHHGFIPQSPSSVGDDTKIISSEYDRLLDILKLPNFESIFDMNSSEEELLNSWCADYLSKDVELRQVPLNLPTKYRLANLPYRLDNLLDESSKRICRTCNNVPEHSAICLICGSFVCARSFCCTELSKGECNNHLKRCGGEIGLYMMIKDCFLLLLHDNGGSIMNAPYLDNHGEADVFFKRGAPQYLNAKRYEQIRQMWLTHSIPSFIRRRMESSQTSTNWAAF
ncbi:hypothetical protein G6F42_008189 [Rhizopus arrhizus]|nr:hypothetical protein G6F42_008189 [Rhizopus arrhizus]